MSIMVHEISGFTVFSSNSVSIEKQNVPESSPDAKRTSRPQASSPALSTICPPPPLLHGITRWDLWTFVICRRNFFFFFCGSRDVHWALGTANRGAGGVFPSWTFPKLTPFVRDDDHKGPKQTPLRPTFSYSDRITRQKVVSEESERVCFGAVARIAELVVKHF